ncbi:MAG TPA: transcription elongation factor GreA [Burkholderiaceae bacterium]
MPRAIGVVVSSRLASMSELSTTLGTHDLYDLLEILAVDAHNERVLSTPKG